MRLLYIHQYFSTREGKSGTRSYEFARRLVQRGHDVTMLTGRAHLEPHMGERRGLLIRFEYEGIHVVVANVAYSQRMSYLRRVLSFIGFALLCGWVVLTSRRFGLVFATSTPLTTGIPALAGWWVRRMPFVFEVRDLWPEVPVQMGILRNRLLIAVVVWLEKTIYLGARHIVALTEGMAAGIRARIGDARPITVIPNASDLDFFGQADGAALRAANGWTDRFICLHAGVPGKAQGLSLVLRAAERLRDDPRLLFLLVGDGNERPVLEREACARSLENVVFWGFQPKTRMPEIMAAADLSLGVYAHFPILETSCANKFFDALAARRPVLLNYSGWQRDALEEYDAGLGCTLGNDEEFIDKLRRLAADPQRCREMGMRARRLAEERFDRDRLAAQFIETLERVVQSNVQRN